MQLTKEQIQKIDIHLKSYGIKFWDLRIEMIDHIVSDIELNSKSEDFKKELKLSLKRIGWFGNLSHINRESCQNVNKKYRKEYHKEFLNFFKNFKKVSILILGIIFFYTLSETLSFKAIERVSLFLFLSPVTFIFYTYFKNLINKHGKSINLDYGTFYLGLSFIILQSVPNFFKEESEDTQTIVWLIVLIIHFIAFSSGYKLYKKSITKVEKMKKELSI